MRKIKRSKLLLILAMALMIVAVGCGKENSSENQASTNNGSQSSENGNSEQIVVRFGHNLTEDAANGQAAIAFKEKLEELTDGQMKVELFPNQQLGSMREQVEQTQMGSIQVTMQGASVYSPFVPSLAMLDLPFLFKDDQTMFDLLQGDIGQDLLAKFDDAQLKGLTFMSHGFRQMTTKDTPITSPDDLKGVNFRVMPSELLIDTIAAWGGNPTPIDFAELYNALQQGVVNAQDNGFESIHEMKFNEVQNNLTVTNHSYLTYVISSNKAWFEGLSPELQEAVLEAAKHASQVSFTKVLENDKFYREKLEEKGMIITELPEEGRDNFIELSQSVYDKYLSSDFEKDIFDRIQEASK